MEPTFYDGTKLLNMLDLNKNKPEIYMVSSNRSAGKTTFFMKYLMDEFFHNEKLFGIMYRFQYEVSDCASKIFNDVQHLFYPYFFMTSHPRARGVYSELWVHPMDLMDEYNDRRPEETGKLCGYAFSINSAEAIKRCSHLLSDVSHILFDEFQSDFGKYVPNETQKFQSIHKSLARGGGKQTRYLPVYMLSNFASILNPYYLELGISDRLRSDTKFLRGNGFVLEINHNQSAADAANLSIFDAAFAGSTYQKSSVENMYLNDNVVFVEPVDGTTTYRATLFYNGRGYSLRDGQGLLYVTPKIDASFKLQYAVTPNDIDVGRPLLDHRSILYGVLRDYFYQGALRFKNLQCKSMMLHLLKLG